jgi:hypothetical protein
VEADPQPRLPTMAALDLPVMAMFPKILELPSGLKLEVSLTPPSPVTELDEERGAAALPGKRLAVCLHPWARLGGNMDDPCVLKPSSYPKNCCSTIPLGDGGSKIEYSGHFFTHSRTITNSTYCATMRAVSGFHQAGSH